MFSEKKTCKGLEKIRAHQKCLKHVHIRISYHGFIFVQRDVYDKSNNLGLIFAAKRNDSFTS